MRGSFTIEAVFVMACILLIIMWLMETSLDLYQQTVITAGIDWINSQETADTFRKIFFLRELVK